MQRKINATMQLFNKNRIELTEVNPKKQLKSHWCEGNEIEINRGL